MGAETGAESGVPAPRSPEYGMTQFCVSGPSVLYVVSRATQKLAYKHSSQPNVYLLHSSDGSLPALAVLELIDMCMKPGALYAVIRQPRRRILNM